MWVYEKINRFKFFLILVFNYVLKVVSKYYNKPNKPKK